MSSYGRAWLVVAILVGSFGTVETVLAVPPLTAWSAGVAVAALTGISHFCWVARDDDTRPPGRDTLRAAGLGGLAGTTTTGLAAVLGGAGVVLVLLVVCSHPRVLRAAAGRVRDLLHLDEGTTRRPAVPPRPDAPVRLPARTGPRQPGATTDPAARSAEPLPDAEGLRALTLTELCWGWRASFTALDRADPLVEYRRWAALVAVRRCYLDEIARRDPEGLARWLYAGARPASDPTRYLSASPAREPDVGRRAA